MCYQWHLSLKNADCCYGPHLSMDEDYRAQKPPCSSLAIHMQHTQDLQEANAPAPTDKQCEWITSTVQQREYRIKIEQLNAIPCLWYLMADVANTCPFDPTLNTMTEAITTIKSAQQEEMERFYHNIHNSPRHFQLQFAI